MNQTSRGGKRSGAGRPKGPQTLEKEAAREIVRQRVYKAIKRLTDAQISNATGIKYLVVRERKTGKFLRVGKGRAEAVNPEEEIIEVWEKDPSVHAFTDLMNRAIDRPKEQELEVRITGELELVPARLAAARARLAPREPEPAVSIEINPPILLDT
jgi:hypothetical protein